MNAKLFLSCGQSTTSDEHSLAENIALRIRALGFECYVAVSQQSLLSLRENIFDQLSCSDYFVFIDFKREGLNGAGEMPLSRGSLFSNQELAIASFLEIPSVILQERGIKQRDGMLSALQANAILFTDRALLANVVADMITQKLNNGEWQADARNCLTLEQADPPYTSASLKGGPPTRFYHVGVGNNHYQKAALGCQAYLVEFEHLATRKLTRPKTVEIKWAGTPLTGVRIGPKTVREFDGILIILSSPIEARFWMISDSPDYIPRLAGPGRYRLRFSVVSHNFGTATSDFILEYGQTAASIHFAKVG
jgi:hypothetical protein